MNISVTHPSLTQCQILIDDVKIIEANAKTTVSIDFETAENKKCTVLFHPFKISPMLRVDGFLINYWLAGVQQQDHRLDFDIGPDFFKWYRNKDRQGRLSSLSDEQKRDEHFLDKYIGIDNLHADLVGEIRRNLDNEKSNTD